MTHLQKHRRSLSRVSGMVLAIMLTVQAAPAQAGVLEDIGSGIASLTGLSHIGSSSLDDLGEDLETIAGLLTQALHDENIALDKHAKARIEQLHQVALSLSADIDNRIGEQIADVDARLSAKLAEFTAQVSALIGDVRLAAMDVADHAYCLQTEWAQTALQRADELTACGGLRWLFGRCERYDDQPFRRFSAIEEGYLAQIYSLTGQSDIEGVTILYADLINQTKLAVCTAVTTQVPSVVMTYQTKRENYGRKHCLWSWALQMSRGMPAVDPVDCYADDQAAGQVDLASFRRTATSQGRPQ